MPRSEGRWHRCPAPAECGLDLRVDETRVRPARAKGKLGPALNRRGREVGAARLAPARRAAGDAALRHAAEVRQQDCLVARVGERQPARRVGEAVHDFGERGAALRAGHERGEHGGRAVGEAVQRARPSLQQHERDGCAGRRDAAGELALSVGEGEVVEVA